MRRGLIALTWAGGAVVETTVADRETFLVTEARRCRVLAVS